jgi:hypothetical protein
MNYTVKPYPRNIPDRVLLADLRKAAKKLKKKYLSYLEYEKWGNFSAMTLYCRFGGWNAALEKAGLKVKKVYRVPDEELLENLKRMWDTLGRQPHYDEMRSPLSRYGPYAYARRYGSWYNSLFALEEAVKSGKLKSSPALAKPAGDKKQLYIKQGAPECSGQARRDSRLEIKKFVKNFNVSKSMRYDVLKRDRFKCKACGRSPATHPKLTLHVDHVKPRAKKGPSLISNLQTLCSECNLGKGAKI